MPTTSCASSTISGSTEAVVGGVSLGGNVSLLVAAQAPERVQGLVIEMPVLEWALPAAAITFIPMLLAVHFARPGGPTRSRRSSGGCPAPASVRWTA